ncbi:alpha/beta fold hydrolase [Microbacterium sp. BG28]|uniref:alpha/beta hydrolase n=1 Tax=Microbacterium sp. BG28 TaxID=3097356 RepID=UPI002A59B727|nr:alpha/beta fold hydrolase [Microbacterium sp. BG28]MDY0827807.1 alpha/beta fold hydrolase [Microbacterium sp. BG28]
MNAWVPDILGPGFAQQTLPLDLPADDGPLVATLVRHLPHPFGRLIAPLRDVDVLYVHGWSDYFFQTELARFWARLGARFYALDLHRYGRSLREGQVPGYADSLDEYDADIAAALAAMGPRNNRRLVLLGHSTGGLTLSLWSARHRGTASAIVLNSPWLEFQIGSFGRQAIAPLIQARARVQPRGSQPVVDLGFYTRAQTELGVLPVPGYREQWRPAQGFATHPGWLHAVLEGHARIAAGVDVGAPAFVLLSARSSSPIRWSEQMTSTDSVLVVDDIARAALKLGPLVTVARIQGAVHDVFLSAPEPRRVAYAELEQWVRARFH